MRTDPSCRATATSRRLVALLALAAVTGCGDDLGGDEPPEDDATLDAVADADAGEQDALSDVPLDTPGPDAGADGGGDDAGDVANDGADEGGGDTVDAADVADVAVDVQDADVDPFDPAFIRARFDLDGADFFASPWPSDARLHDDGTPDLSNFPQALRAPLPTFRAAIEHVVVGYATMPTVYVSFVDDITEVGLPTPLETLDTTAVAQLIDVSEGGCGRRIPMVINLDVDGDPYRPANTWSASPVPGFVLAPATPYAFVLRPELGADTGRTLRQPSAVAAALADDATGELADSFGPLRRCVASGAAGMTSADVAVATVFTTQEVVSELRTIRATALDPERTAAPALADLDVWTDRSNEARTVWRGHYDTPIYQTGVSPYAAGGAFAWDPAGQPSIQRWETVPFTVTLPATGEGPFPVMVYMGGTGFSLSGALSSKPVPQMLAEGFAVATFAPQFHDSRAVPGSDPVTHGFNYLNPTAGRTVFRQQVVDTAYFVRVLREGLAGTAVGDAIDASHLVYAGHSQGGIVGAFVAGVETEFEAYVLNGTGTYISVTITERVDPVDIPALFEEFFGLGRPMDVQHPLAALVQLGLEVVEPHNYAREWPGHDGRPGGVSVFISNGWNDVTTFPPSMDAMAIAGDLDVVAPAGWDPDPYNVWDRPLEVEMPISGNREGRDGTPRTAVTFLDLDGDHHTLSENERVLAAAVRFLTSAIVGTPVVGE
ncbi:MAG: hypothetical protein H6698_07150 [Myxococcales bacterium]|nr:hypothetical protein [Myxococcales bacterium]MCB9521533.1 hypothetical protein [Myxococcales bacterium]MCB9534084.1 hypothetical protein [Myxococcales bacterium]